MFWHNCLLRLLFRRIMRRDWAKRASNLFIIENIAQKGVSFSDFICTFAMSFKVKYGI